MILAKLSCSCPDNAVPCKHIAAVIYKLSQEIDANPFVLFTLRGIDIFAGLEEYGINMGESQTTEMPSWRDLLNVPAGGLAPLPLSYLNELSYSAFDDIKDSLLGLFTDTPPGYNEGSLKKTMQKVLEKAAKLAQK